MELDMDVEDGFDSTLFTFDGVAGKMDDTKEKSLAGLDNNLEFNLESFGKKKRKPFDLDELKGALPPNGADNGPSAIDETKEEEFNLNVDFSMEKGKSKKEEDLDELFTVKMDDDKNDDKENLEDNNSFNWAGSDRDYAYDELLKRVFEKS